MSFARWQHHLRFRRGLPYAPLKAMVTKISKWSRIQDSFWITPEIKITCSFCHFRHAIKISERSFQNFLSYLADTQTNRQTNKVWKKHNLLGRGNESNGANSFEALRSSLGLFPWSQFTAPFPLRATARSAQFFDYRLIVLPLVVSCQNADSIISNAFHL